MKFDVILGKLRTVDNTSGGTGAADTAHVSLSENTAFGQTGEFQTNFNTNAAAMVQTNTNSINAAVVNIAQNTADIQENIDELESHDIAIASLLQRVNSLEGLGGNLDAYNFGSATPAQQQICQYACTDIWGAGGTFTINANLSQSTYTDTDGTVHRFTDILSGTTVRNIFDNNEWELNNTPTTTPPVFNWANVGQSIVSLATDTIAGVVKGGGKTHININGEIELVGVVTTSLPSLQIFYVTALPSNPLANVEYNVIEQ